MKPDGWIAGDWVVIPPEWTHEPFTKVVFDTSFADARPKNMYALFYGCNLLEQVIGLEYLNTSEVTEMRYMFSGCSSLTSLDLSSFDTSNVEYMSNMFSGCSSLTSLNLSSFDTSNVTIMSWMFNDCSSLTSLDLSSFNTSSVKSYWGTVHDVEIPFSGIDGMFSGCNSLTSLDLSNFDTSKVEDMHGMFDGCSSLTSLNLSSFDTSNVTIMSWMFNDCSSLTNLNLSNFDTSNVEDMYGMFSGCSSLTSLDLSGFDTSNVEDMWSMFSGCSRLTGLDLSSFDTSKVKWMNDMFSGCSSLTSLDLSNFDTSNVEDMEGVFYNCNNLTSLDLSGFDMSNVKWMDDMFSGCSSLADLYISSTMYNLDEDVCEDIGTEETPCRLHAPEGFDFGDLDTSGTFKWKGGWFVLASSEPVAYAVLSSDGTTLTFRFDALMGEGGGTFYSLDGRDANNRPQWANNPSVKTVVFDASFASARPESTNRWFSKMTGLTRIEGMGNLDTSSATDMKYMFAECSSLKAVDLSHFDTSSATTMFGMFYGCKNLTSLDLSAFDTSSVTDMGWMFYDCKNLKSIDVSGFSASSLVSMEAMFHNCTSLRSSDLSGFSAVGVTSMKALFYNCRSLKSVALPSAGDALSTTYAMFYNCASIESLDLAGLSTRGVASMGWMFGGCSSLESLDVVGLSTSSCTSFEAMFSGCSSLSSLDLSGFDLSNATNTSGMMDGCSGLSELHISETMSGLQEDACSGVGTDESPCKLHAPEGFDFGGADTSGAFTWKSGVFRLALPNALMADAAPLFPGETARVVVSLDNAASDVVGFQFDLVLPAGFEPAGSGGACDVVLSDRFSGQVSVAGTGEGRYRFIGFSMSGATVSGHSGELLSIVVRAMEGMPSGTYRASLEDVVLGTASEESLHLADVPFTLDVQAMVRGDVNRDGVVDVTDVMMTVDHILGGSSERFHAENADCNGDGAVDVTDVTIIVRIILTGGSGAPSDALLSPAAVDARPSVGGFDVSVSGMPGLRAFQFVVSLPRNATLSGASLPVESAATHVIDASPLGGGRFMVVAYSPVGEEFLPGGASVHLDVAGTAESACVSDIQMADLGDSRDNSPEYGLGGQRTGSHHRGVVVTKGRKRVAR